MEKKARINKKAFENSIKLSRGWLFEWYKQDYWQESKSKFKFKTIPLSEMFRKIDHKLFGFSDD